MHWKSLNLYINVTEVIFLDVYIYQKKRSVLIKNTIYYVSKGPFNVIKLNKYIIVYIDLSRAGKDNRVKLIFT